MPRVETGPPPPLDNVKEFYVGVVLGAFDALWVPKKTIRMLGANMLPAAQKVKLYEKWLRSLIVWTHLGDKFFSNFEAATQINEQITRKKLSQEANSQLSRIKDGWNPFTEKSPQGRRPRNRGDNLQNSGQEVRPHIGGAENVPR